MGQLPGRVIGVGASAGGVEALRTLAAGLPAELDAAVCVVLHIPASGRSLLAPILARDCALTVLLAEDGMALEAGTLYVARADQHLLVERDHIELGSGPKENGARPAVDPLLRSLASAWGTLGIGVVLSGALDDGAAGAAALTAAGGRVIVQDPEDALVSSMPASALAASPSARVLPVAEIGPQLGRLAAMPSTTAQETVVSPQPEPAEGPLVPPRPAGPPTGFTCPECHGPLWEVEEGGFTRFRCRVGHAYSEQAMVEAQGGQVEAALWTALEVLQERSELLLRIADRLDTRAAPRSEQQFRDEAHQAMERADAIRKVLAMSGAAA
jgi:two-component system chemotaxis response regulator CheB